MTTPGASSSHVTVTESHRGYFIVIGGAEDV